jgi:hypothetical protein
MGNNNVRNQGSGLTNYGAGYDPYYNYGDIENYGSAYQPTGGDYPFDYGLTNGPFVTSMRSPLGGYGQSGLRRYGNSYPAGFNPILQPGLGGPKVRIIYVPNNVVSGFQNLLQQNGMGGGNPLMGGFGGPQIMPQMPFGPSAIPQMPWANPMMPQMGSNCCSMSLQVPSMTPQMYMPMPCPPPMIQPMMPQISMRKIMLRLFVLN